MDIQTTYEQAKRWAEDKTAQAMPGGGVTFPL